MDSSVIKFPRDEEEYSWYEITTDSLIAANIVYGDVVECHAENYLCANSLYVIIFAGHILIRYLYQHDKRITLVPAYLDMPLIHAAAPQITVIGRIVRYCHKGQWRTLEELKDDFWMRWAIEEAS